MTAEIEHWEAAVAALWEPIEALLDALPNCQRSMRNYAAALTDRKMVSSARSPTAVGTAAQDLVELRLGMAGEGGQMKPHARPRVRWI